MHDTAVNNFAADLPLRRRLPDHASFPGRQHRGQHPLRRRSRTGQRTSRGRELDEPCPNIPAGRHDHDLPRWRSTTTWSPGYQDSGGALNCRLGGDVLARVHDGPRGLDGHDRACPLPGLHHLPRLDDLPRRGPCPQVEVLYSTADASAPAGWQYAPAAQNLRGYQVARGRGNTLSTHEAGTATLELLEPRARLRPEYAAPSCRWIAGGSGRSSAASPRIASWATRTATRWPGPARARTR